MGKDIRVWAAIMNPLRAPENDAEAYEMAYKCTAAIRGAKYWQEVLKDYVRAGGKISGNGYEWVETNRGFRWQKIK